MNSGMKAGYREVIQGQVHVEARPSPQFALNRYAATMLSDYSVHDREAETGALPDGFCREERIENVLHGRLIHPASGIADVKANRRIGWRQRILWRLRIARRRELNGDRTMLVTDRLGGVGDEIEQQLVKLVGISEQQGDALD